MTTKKQDTTTKEVRTKGGKLWGEFDKKTMTIIVRKGKTVDTIDLKELLASS